MFENFTSFDITTQSDPHISIHGIQSGSGPPLLLLHGFPQTHHIWHLIAPKLTSTYTVIALDLRGYGASSKPSGVGQYAKSAMARDIVTVMSTLGHSTFYVCAHDRGARVTHKLLVDYPDLVKKAILLDICPTLAMYTQTNLEFAKVYWHWFFLIQKSPLPETLISGEPRKFAELFMGGRSGGYRGFEKEAWEEYVRVLGEIGAVHAMCEDYRASSTVDLDESRRDLEEGKLIKCPIRVLWGKHGVIEKCFDALKEWKGVAEEGVEVSGMSVDCGHYVPEQAPDEVLKNIRELFH
ncbi:alpha/beta-hydrolase [Stipitochalara longipes BDJ]|nr:alpha/beta-hydrolase [Stipitochalara longipes BDJ]